MKKIVNQILELDINQKGRDIVVGDIHGCFQLLKKALKSINFDKNIDRLICTGDLIDKGNNSIAAIDWLNTDYFFSAMGNHDAQYAFNNLEEFNLELPVCLPIDFWFTKITEEKFLEFSSLIKEKTYPAIEIKTKKGTKVAVVHAEIPLGYNWASFKKNINNGNINLFINSIWNRDIAITSIFGYETPLTENEILKYFIPDIDYVFHGHTVSSESFLLHLPYSIANRFYIDTAAYKNTMFNVKSAGITLFDIENPLEPLVFFQN